MRWLLLILAICNFASFFWSVIGVFRKVKDQKTGHYRLLQLNSLLLWILGSWAIYNLDPSEELRIGQLILLATQIFCLVLFWRHSRIVRENGFSIVFSNDQPVKLVVEGMYKKIRHPFYMIYLICYFSIALGTQNFWLMLLSISIFALYYQAAKQEEGKFLSSPLASQYLDYQKSTGMFYPKLW